MTAKPHHADFVHLRVHSAYSLSEGAIKVKDMVKLAVDAAMPAVAVCDTGNLFGALEFSFAARDSGVQPIIGCLLGVTRDDADQRLARRPPPDRLPVLVQNETGYLNLLHLVSKAFLDSDGGDDPQVALADMEGHTDGLIALTGGPGGAIGRMLAEGQKPAATALVDRLTTLFPGRLYVEILRHGMELEDRTEEAFIDFAYEKNLPLVATNDTFFSHEGMHEAHDALLCIAGSTYVAQNDRRKLTPQHRFKTAKEMRALFEDLPEACDNTLVIARRCAYMPDKRPPILPPFATESGRDETEELREQAFSGLTERLERGVWQDGQSQAEKDEVAKPYRDRLDYELGVINQMGFPGYFLIVSDFIKWAKQQGIPVGPGRGSGAGSVVAWALTITDLDPLRFGLLFERFLNPERVSMPDFDVDFCMDRRDEVIRYVQDRYGRDKVAQIITFGKLQARAVLRDTGRVLEMPYGQVDRICKMVPNNPANPVTLGQAIEGEPQLREMIETDETVEKLAGIAQKLEGLYRHASTHAAGVVIGDRPLQELVPLYRDPRSDMPVTQFNMKYVEQAGLVKFDFLGLKTLTVLENARRLMARRGIEIDLSNLPLDDKKTFDMLSRGEASGVFQLESSGMRDVLRKLKPDRFEDIIAVVALYRPGPMDNIPSYIKRKHGEETPDYLHPVLEPMLRETYGIMIYQEQVMQAAQELAGYTLGGADLLRRAMGKKIKAEMDAQRETFVKGAVEQDVKKAVASSIFDQIAKFAGYGFNKSHAAAYALVAYQTAYLKANYPVEFFAALMSADLNNTDKLAGFRQELVRMGIKVLPPDINRSGWDFGVEETDGGELAVRYALAAIKNVGEVAMQSLAAERQSSGEFRDIKDFADRLDVKQMNRRQLENLVSAGAFDKLVAERRRLFDGIEMVLKHAQATTQERESNQVNLFAGDAAQTGLQIKLPQLPDWAPTEKLKREFDAVGFYLSAHPLDAYEASLRRLNVVSFADLPQALREGRAGHKKMAGIVVAKQFRTSARGNRFAFISVSDASGVFEVVLFSEALVAARDILDSGEPVILTVDARQEDDSIRLTGQAVHLLDAAASRAAMGLRIFVRDQEPIQKIKSILDQEGRGTGRVNIVVETDIHEEVELELGSAFSVKPATRSAIKSIPGIVDVHDV